MSDAERNLTSSGSGSTPVKTRNRVDSTSGLEDTCDYRSYKSRRSAGASAPSLSSDGLAPPDAFSTQGVGESSPHSGKGGESKLSRSSSPLLIKRQATVEENPNPQPNAAPNPTQSGTNGDKVVVVMVGLPARGKTYIARKLAHYFKFFHGAPTKVVNVGNFRREISGAKMPASFFDHDNKEAMSSRRQASEEAMKALVKFMEKGSEKGRVGIFDATNTTVERRSWILSQLVDSRTISSRSHVLFLETICTDEDVIEANIRAVKTTMPDYVGQTPEDAVRDFRKRIENYRKVYQTIRDESLSWIKLVDEGRQITANNIKGSLQSNVLQFVLSLHNTPRPIYLSRHGQSEYNKLGKVGGDSDLSDAGEEYALKLAEFARKEIQSMESIDPSHLRRCNPKHARLWTSSLVRTINTARHIEHDTQPDGWVTMRPRIWRNLDEIYAGIFDGLTYAEIEARAPEEFSDRQKNKLSYRYPRGESYLDVIGRLEPLVHELERQRDPVLIVGHQGILRILYCYFLGIDRSKAPFHKIPLNTVIKLTPAAYGCKAERVCLIPGDVAKVDQPSH